MESSPSTPRPSRHPLGPWLLPLLLGGAALAVLFYWQGEIALMGLDPAFPLDDSWIHLQFARNLSAGDGLSYNPGELVTGSTAPLWTAVAALFFLLPGDPLWWIKIAGVALHLAAIAATWRLGRELDLSPGLAAFAAAMTAGTYWLVWSALSGMEIPLFVLLTLWGMILHLRERREGGRPPLSLGVLGLAVLARPEGLLLLGLAVADRLLVVERREDGLHLAPPPWRSLAGGLALAAVALVPAVVFHYAVGGTPFPSTFAAKTTQSLSLPEPRYLHLVLGILFKPQPYLTLLVPAGLLALIERLGTRRDRGLLPGLWVLALPLAYGALSASYQGTLVGNFGRYFFPLFPPLAVVGTVGLARAAAALGPWLRLGSQRLPLRALLVVVLALPTLTSLVANRHFYTTNLTNVEESDVALGLWVRDNVPPGAVIAVQDIGAVKYLAPNPILDLVGLVSPDLVPHIRGAMSPRDPGGDLGVLRYLEEEKPDLLAAFSNWRPRLSGNRELFRPLARFRVSYNITMAGDEMVLYLTPWSRFTPPPELVAPPELPGEEISAP